MDFIWRLLSQGSAPPCVVVWRRRCCRMCCVPSVRVLLPVEAGLGTSVSNENAVRANASTRKARTRFVQPQPKRGNNFRNMIGRTMPPTADPVAAKPKATARRVVNSFETTETAGTYTRPLPRYLCQQYDEGSIYQVALTNSNANTLREEYLPILLCQTQHH